MEKADVFVVINTAKSKGYHRQDKRRDRRKAAELRSKFIMDIQHFYIEKGQGRESVCESRI